MNWRGKVEGRKVVRKRGGRVVVVECGGAVMSCVCGTRIVDGMGIFDVLIVDTVRSMQVGASRDAGFKLYLVTAG